MPSSQSGAKRAARLEWAARGQLTVRSEQFEAGLGVKLLYISDLHLSGRWTERVVRQILSVTKTERPDVVLLGGDLVDRRAALPQLEALLESLKNETGEVLAIPGNHDHWAGEHHVREIVTARGGHWLPDGAYCREGLVIQSPATEPVPGKFSVLCAHEPSVIKTVSAENYDLILAGHLHGCQWVLWERYGNLFPGAWFYRWNGPRYELGEESTLLVSRGVNDTFPLRWNCPREILACLL